MCGVCGCHPSDKKSHGDITSFTRIPNDLLQVEKDILSENNRYAAENRTRFDSAGVFAVNLISSPGAGKTTILVKTVEMLRASVPVAVIEGDQQTSIDADRIRATGVPAVQVNTGRGCHLDAHMVGQALDDLGLETNSILFIENVGNLVCPASFDLGEAKKVALLSVTEGEDKPLKYPDVFAAASLMVLTKIDLLPHLRFDAARCIEHARAINPGIGFLKVSAETGEGMDDWTNWLFTSARRAPDHKRYVPYA
jgi:hydrogenase nickel incorporation protein HypB